MGRTSGMRSFQRQAGVTPSPACGGGLGRGSPEAGTRGKSPLPSPPPQAGEGGARGHALLHFALLALISFVLASPALAEKGKLRERLTPEVMAAVYPGAERLGPEEGSPPAIAVYKGDQLVAYIFSTPDIIAA